MAELLDCITASTLPVRIRADVDLRIAGRCKMSLGYYTKAEVTYTTNGSLLNAASPRTGKSASRDDVEFDLARLGGVVNCCWNGDG